MEDFKVLDWNFTIDRGEGNRVITQGPKLRVRPMTVKFASYLGRSQIVGWGMMQKSYITVATFKIKPDLWGNTFEPTPNFGFF